MNISALIKRKKSTQKTDTYCKSTFQGKNNVIYDRRVELRHDIGTRVSATIHNLV